MINQGSENAAGAVGELLVGQSGLQADHTRPLEFVLDAVHDPTGLERDVCHVNEPGIVHRQSTAPSGVVRSRRE